MYINIKMIKQLKYLEAVGKFGERFQFESVIDSFLFRGHLFLVHTEDDDSSKAEVPLAKSYIKTHSVRCIKIRGAIQSMPAMWPHPSPNSCCRASKEFMRLMVRVAPLLGAALSCWIALLTPKSGESEETTWVIGLGMSGTFCATDSLRYMSTAVSLLIGLRDRRLLLLAKRLRTLSWCNGCWLLLLSDG